jgi:hypothetical protein
MAKSTSRPPKKPTPIDASTPFDAPVDDMSAAEAPPPEQTAPETPVRPNVQPKTPKTPTFSQTMNSVPKGDWGARANIYLYRVEPIIDRTRSGDSKYINCYAEPINEDRVMADYGSGRYKLILNFRKPGAATGDLIDSEYWDILNMKYPPKIPLGEWTDDPRNKKWAWAKEANGIPTAPAPAPAANGLESVVDVMRATNEMRRDIREEMQAATPPTPPAAPAAPDPFDTAAKIMAMRANDPMMAVMMELLKNANVANEASRQREYELLRERATAAPPVPQKNILEQALELASNPDKLEPLKKLAAAFGFGGGESAGRAGRTTGMDILQSLVSGPAGEVLARGAAQLLITIPSMLQPNPATANGNGQPAAQPQPQVLPPVNQQPAQENSEQRIHRIGATITRPMIAEWFMKDATGQQFAAWMNDSWPDDYQFIKLLGAENLIQRYRNSPMVWPAISYREAEFITFIQEFCAWTEPKDEDEQTQAASDGVEDLEDKETENA